MFRITFKDGSYGGYYDMHIIENGLWISAYESETHKMTYIPSSQIRKCVDLGKSNRE